MAQQNNTRVRVPKNLTSDAGIDWQQSNEVVSLNPPGRGRTEDGACKTKNLVSCKSTTIVSTMNVRTIRERCNREELAANLIEHNIDILGIQEHRIVHNEPVKYEDMLGSTLITTSATKNKAGAATGGVGIMLSSKAKRSLSNVLAHTDRILIANFQGNPAVTVIVNYSPTNVTEEDIVEEHHDNLRKAIDSVPAHNVLLIVGDFNARIGTADAKFPFHKETNRNGQYLLELAMERNLIITNTQYQKREGKLWTYISPGGNRFQLDYILIRRKWRNSVKNVEAYNTFASVGSDHRIVSAHIRLSLRTSKAAPKRKQHDWKCLSTDANIQKQYAIEVRNRFEGLEIEDESATDRYERFIKANQEATEKVIPLKKKAHKTRFSSNPRVIAARDAIKDSYQKYQKSASDNDRETYEAAKKVLSETYNQVMEEDLSEKIQEVQRAHANSQHGVSWKIINDITGRKASAKGMLLGSSQKERVQNWYNHFKDLLGKPPDICEDVEDLDPILTDLDIKTGPFEHEEYIQAKRSLVEGKSCGEDNIPPEVLKRCDLDDIVLEFCNDAFINRRKPSQWSILNIVPIPKSGDLSQAGNYRGISLSSLVAKTYNRMILNRIRPKLDKHLRTNQNGFRVGRSTVGHILALRRLIEGVKAYNLSAIITFIDFCKAFDSIHRGKMLQILRAYGIPDQIVDAIGDMYQDTMAKVVSPDGETDLFEILAGVLQGDTLAPYLFVIILDYALRSAIEGKEEELGFHLTKRRSRRIGPEMVTDFDFADDIALISEEVHQAQELLQRVQTSVAKVGLKINTKKTKFMSTNQTGFVKLHTTDGTNLDEVQDFKYLGSWMESTAKDVKQRKAAAWRACNKLNKLWKSSLSREFKLQLFAATVETVLLYGSEAWTVTPKIAKELDGCYTRMLRVVQNVSWKQHMTNTELYRDLPKISQKIKIRRLRFAGHCFRSNECVSKLIHWIPKHGSRKPGRPAINFVDTLKRDTGLDTNEMKTAMLDRQIWSAIVDRGHHSN